MDKQTMRAAILEAKAQKGITWEQLGQTIGMSPVWTASACLGENSVPADLADEMCNTLGLPSEVAAALQECPLKGSSIKETVPRDPLIYRLYEVMTVYGESIKQVIHEKFGDGIMSAIDFTLDVDVEKDPKGDRVVLTWNGKFLPYKRW
ncbi:MAG: cyanase [Nitrococcus mobilis]|nr:cyanase [Nitrococcus mobilis]